MCCCDTCHSSMLVCRKLRSLQAKIKDTFVALCLNRRRCIGPSGTMAQRALLLKARRRAEARCLRQVSQHAEAGSTNHRSTHLSAFVLLTSQRKPWPEHHGSFQPPSHAQLRQSPIKHDHDQPSMLPPASLVCHGGLKTKASRRWGIRRHCALTACTDNRESRPKLRSMRRGRVTYANAHVQPHGLCCYGSRCVLSLPYAACSSWAWCLVMHGVTC